jgi:transcription elongation factor GreA-like protein
MTFDKPIGGGRHIGRRIGSGESGGFEVDYEDDTVAADQKAIELKMRDAFATITKPEFFQKYVDKATESVDRPVHDNPADTVEIVAKEFGYRESVKDSIISHLLHGGQWNQWGVSQAVTRVAADQDSYDQASTMEADGGKILNMDGAAWKQILDAEVPN